MDITNNEKSKLQSCTLMDTSIFDCNLYTKIEELIKKGTFVTEEDKHYSLTVIFNVALLDEKKSMNDYYSTIPKKPYEINSKYDYKEIISNNLTYVLDSIELVLGKYLSIVKSTIAGDNIEFLDITIIELE